MAKSASPRSSGKGGSSSPKGTTRTAKAPRSIGRPTGKGRIGKELLVEKTADLLRTLPPEKLSLSVAARHAHVHLTLFRYYFEDRTRLLIDVARMLSKDIGDRVAAIETDAKTAPERLAIRIDTMVDFFMENPFYHRLMVEVMDNEADPLATELINLWMSKTMDIYGSLIDAGVAEGSLRPIDPYFTFLAIMGLCEKFRHASKLLGHGEYLPDETPEAAAARYKGFILDMIMQGVGTEPIALAPSRKRAGQ